MIFEFGASVLTIILEKESDEMTWWSFLSTINNLMKTRPYLVKFKHKCDYKKKYEELQELIERVDLINETLEAIGRHKIEKD
jgi:hypothetical protein